MEPGFEFAAGRAPRVVAIGNFDGVHLGHQAVLKSVRDDAARRGLEPAVLTFAPHPLSVLGRPVPPVLTVLARKLELIRREFPEVIVAKFDRAFAQQTPLDFARNVLVTLGVRQVVVGQNFRFGRGRAGDFDELVRLGEGLGFETRSYQLVGDALGPWSSSRVRDALSLGDLVAVERMLGRPHMVSGVVVEGDRRGRTLGFPTCNIAVTAEALPPNGVYAVLVDLESIAEGRTKVLEDGMVRGTGGPPAQALAKGVANVGIRPTVGPAAGGHPSVEVHLFDFDGDLYGRLLRVHFMARLREERTFAGLGPLKAQIARDAEAARQALAGTIADPLANGAYR